MRFATSCWCLVLGLAALSGGAEPVPPPKEDPGAELARLIHKSMAAKMPRVFEDKSA